MPVQKKPRTTVATQARRKTPSKSKPKSTTTTASCFPKPETTLHATDPATRIHGLSYHFPLLLNDSKSCDALLEWFKSVQETRSMPWRKEWIDAGEFEGTEEELGKVMSKRAYEVWVSEIMLQQTRVSTVIPYFNNWVAKWPTIHHLAKASHDDVLSAWKGLGYYSRATRLHEGAKAMIFQNNDKACPIPSSAEDLQEFPGIGRYTAGAISSIVFGRAEPVLDGNVIRVLSRQLGLFVDAKDKKANDMLWAVADQLVKHAARHPESQRSDVPGDWNQALMELGSTVCTPAPKCAECPIQGTCRAYAEGQALTRKEQSSTAIPDIEDSCSFCEQLDTDDLVNVTEETEGLDEGIKATKKRKRQPTQANTISQYFAAETPSTSLNIKNQDNEGPPTSQSSGGLKRKDPGPSAESKSIATYCSLFPKRVPKKKVAEEDCVVCIVELRPTENGGRSKWLIEQRPAKGLLASLWQFPQATLPQSKQSSASQRKASAHKFLSNLAAAGQQTDMSRARYVAAFDPLVHVFSHLKLTMYALQFRIDAGKSGDLEQFVAGSQTCKWVDTESMDSETLSTGMRRCWDLVRKSL